MPSLTKKQFERLCIAAELNLTEETAYALEKNISKENALRQLHTLATLGATITAAPEDFLKNVHDEAKTSKNGPIESIVWLWAVNSLGTPPKIIAPERIIRAYVSKTETGPFAYSSALPTSAFDFGYLTTPREIKAISDQLAELDYSESSDGVDKIKVWRKELADCYSNYAANTFANSQMLEKFLNQARKFIFNIFNEATFRLQHKSWFGERPQTRTNFFQQVANTIAGREINVVLKEDYEPFEYSSVFPGDDTSNPMYQDVSNAYSAYSASTQATLRAPSHTAPAAAAFSNSKQRLTTDASQLDDLLNHDAEVSDPFRRNGALTLTSTT